jgi:hypothetical protein
VDADFANVTGVETVALTGASSIVLGANATTSGIATVITGNDVTSITSTQTALAVDATLLATTKALTLLGSANYTVTSTGTIFDKVTATGSTGTLSVTFGDTGTNAVPFATGNGNTTVLGGAAADVITVTGLETASQTFTGSVAKFDVTGGANTQIITTGGADDTVRGGASADIINVGTGTDKVIVATDETGAAAATAGSLTALGVIGASTLSFSTSTVDIVTGINSAGDLIQLYTTGTTAITTSNVLLTGASTWGAATVGDVALVKGNYVAATNTFTASTTGSDSALIWDSNGTTAAGSYAEIILVGYVDAGTVDTISTAGLFTVVA